MITLQARVMVNGNSNPENNSAFASAQVFPAPHTLFISDELERVQVFGAALQSGGIQIDAVSPDQFPTDVQSLEQYQVIFLDNLLIQSLTQEQVAALKLFVSKFGKGLVFLGGQHTYTLGGFENSSLEPILPVRMQPPERSHRTPVTFVLVIDTSSSMSRDMPLAREAALRVIETLQPDDTLGILSYSDDPYWDLPLGKVGEGLNLRTALDSVSRLHTLAGTQTYKALKEVVSTMGPPLEDEKRTVLLLSDGKSGDGAPELFKALANTAIKQGITISTIALGNLADQITMSSLAGWGNGRYYLHPHQR